jgi:hypothetical protein
MLFVCFVRFTCHCQQQEAEAQRWNGFREGGFADLQLGPYSLRVIYLHLKISNAQETFK